MVSVSPCAGRAVAVFAADTGDVATLGFVSCRVAAACFVGFAFVDLGVALAALAAVFGAVFLAVCSVALSAFAVVGGFAFFDIGAGFLVFTPRGARTIPSARGTTQRGAAICALRSSLHLFR